MISGALIRQARQRAGLSQAELARRAGKAISAIGRWERGEVRPALETVIELIRAAGLDLEMAIVRADDHDRALIRRSLSRPPARRLIEMVEAVRKVHAMVAAAGG
ncbi:MAG: helix-turn-helix domain-containing protein [Thermoanaerobaculia bacterium]